MKEIKTLEISTSSTSVECYNNMKTKTPSTFEEACRCIEAIECVRSHPFLVRRIKEEVCDD